MLLERRNLDLRMIHFFEECGVLSKAAIPSLFKGWSNRFRLDGFSCSQSKAHTYYSMFPYFANWEPRGGCFYRLPCRSHRRDIGVTKFRMYNWIQCSSRRLGNGINPSFRPRSGIQSPSAIIPHQPILYNIPKSE